MFFLDSTWQALEDLSIEKQVLKERYESALEAAKSQGQEGLANLQKDHANKMDQVLQAHKAELEKQQKEAAAELARLKQVNRKTLNLLQFAMHVFRLKSRYTCNKAGCYYKQGSSRSGSVKLLSL